VADSFLRHSPLDHLGLAARASDVEAGTGIEAGVSLGERPYRGLVNLRGPAGDKAFDAAVKKALGVALPVGPTPRRLKAMSRSFGSARTNGGW